jgi:hypothetical protein
MKTFKEWLLNEAPGVYGSSDYVPIHNRQDYRQNVYYGKRGEDDVLSRMERSCGWKVQSGNDIEDMRFGVDGYIMIQGRRSSMQIKRKANTNSLAFELSCNKRANEPTQPPPLYSFLTNLNGRDLTSSAKVYVIADTSNTQISAIYTADIRKLISQEIAKWKNVVASPMLKKYPQLERKYINDFMRGVGDQNVTLKIIWDTKYNYWKMMGYVNSSMIKPIQVCRLQ